MKLVIASDIHGSLPALERVIERFNAEHADKLILLGDLYYHGPRNPMQEGYAPMEVANRLNGISDLLIVVKGNCDAEVDETISQFPFKPALLLRMGERKVLLSHGHRKPDLSGVDLWIHGHTHVSGIWREPTLRANPGSPSLPKENSPRGVLVLTSHRLALTDLDGKTLDGEDF